MVTGWVQSIYYGISIRAGEPKPPPGSPRYVKHRRRINILVIAVYLLYTIYEADWQMRRAGDFYSDLGVTPAVEDRVIKSKFRRLYVGLWWRLEDMKDRRRLTMGQRGAPSSRQGGLDRDGGIIRRRFRAPPPGTRHAAPPRQAICL